MSAVESDTAVELNAPLSDTPVAGYVTGPTITYSLGKNLPSTAVLDTGHPWNPFSGSFAAVMTG